jgi:hypothetical protein
MSAPRRLPRIALAIVLSATGTIVLAQTSASYKLTESTLNDGGRPANGSIASSASYRIRLDAVGSAVGMTGLSSASQHMDGGFVADYPPPGEVSNERWTSKTALSWDPEKSVGAYEVYRDLLSALPGSFGTCFQSALSSEAATDAANPAVGTAWFYLVTARNRLGEEGTLGFRSSGAERSNTSPCP